MTEEEGAPTLKGEYPRHDLPVVFAEGAASLNWSGGVAKFYLVRFDPDLRVLGPSEDRPVIQIVMPIRGFVSTAVFFQRALEAMVRDGTIPSEMLEDARRIDAEAKEAFDDARAKRSSS